MLLKIDDVKVNDYFKKHITGSTLIGFVPVKDPDDGIISYYSVACGHSIYKRVVPVFAIPPNRTQQIFSTAKRAMVEQKLPDFVFDSENFKLTNKNKEIADSMKKHLEENPFVLFFRGGDDGHKGMRFKNEQEAMEYLEMFDFFDEVIHEEDMQIHN